MSKSKKGGQTEFEMTVLERLDRLDAAVAQMSGSRGNRVGGWLAAMVATSQPRIDGRVTFADLFVTSLSVGGISISGLTAGAGAFILSSGDLDALLRVWGGATIAGGALGILRIGGDLLNLRAIWQETFGAVLDRLFGEPDYDDESALTAGGHGRTVIRPGRAPRPDRWEKLSSIEKVKDVYDFARTVWTRERAGLPIGQKEFRELRHVLPSGFVVSDEIHGIIFEELKVAGAAHRKGRGWALESFPSPPALQSYLERTIKVEDW